MWFFLTKNPTRMLVNWPINHHKPKTNVDFGHGVVFPETSWWMKPEGYCSLSWTPRYFPNWTLSHRICWEYSYGTPPWWFKNHGVKRVKRSPCLPFESIDSGLLLIRLQSSTPWRFHHPQRDCWAKKLGRLALQWLGDWGNTPSLNIG